jgi:glycosyltransferase involved in cell wall biosynthesis
MESISYLLPIKNGESYLIDIFQYFERNFNDIDQIVFVNDSSDDNTIELLNEFSKKHSNWNIEVINSSGTGLVEALNIGANECDYAWIARFDVDDKYVDGRIEKQRIYLNENVAAVFCDYKLHFPNGLTAGFIPSPIDNLSMLLSLPISQQTPHPGVIFNKEKFKQVGMYSQQDFPIEDIALWFRLAKTGQLISVPEILLNYRISNSGTIGSRRKLAEDKLEQLTFNLDSLWSQIEMNLADLPKIYLELKSYPDSFERKLFFIRNIRYWRKRGYVLPNFTRFEFLTLLTLLLSNSIRFARLFYFQLLRLAYRSKIS